jgi:ATP-dependent DNA helicase RecG
MSTTNTDKFREAICAFSNDMPAHGMPGYLLIGVSDDGSIDPKFRVTDDLLKQLASYRDDGQILPQPSLSVFRQGHPAGGELVVVEVQPSDMPPVRYKQRVHIRVGPRKGTANETEERRLTERRASVFRSFDLNLCPSASLDDLDLDAFQNTYRREAVDVDVIRENHRDVSEQLGALRFFNLKRNCPTNAGVVVFAKDPLAFFPGAYIQFAHFDGKTLADPPLEQKSFTGNLMVVLRELDAFLRGKFRQQLVKSSVLTEALVWDYPEDAMRELLMNAVVHRDYESNQPVRFFQFSDRIEIQNPGGLFGDARPENFPNVNDYRNPVLAEAMKILGYVNRFGRGVTRAQKILNINGSPPADFAHAQTHFVATVWKRGEI